MRKEEIKTVPLREIADVLCVPVTSFSEYDGKIHLPFYGPTSRPFNYESTWEDEFLRRINGVKEIPVGEYFMTVKLNDVIESRDYSKATELFNLWREQTKDMTWNEQELFIHLWFKVMPKLKLCQ